MKNQTILTTKQPKQRDSQLVYKVAFYAAQPVNKAKRVNMRPNLNNNKAQEGIVSSLRSLEVHLRL